MSRYWVTIAVVVEAESEKQARFTPDVLPKPAEGKIVEWWVDEVEEQEYE